MKLAGVIRLLEEKEKDITLERGLVKPHLSRGDYFKLAFVISDSPMTVKEILDIVNECLDKIFVSHKGGNYLVTSETEVVLVPTVGAIERPLSLEFFRRRLS